MGLIVLAVAILPLLGVGGRQIFKAETPGPMKESKLTPRMAETAKGLWLVYAGDYAGVPARLQWAGMSWGDAMIHTLHHHGSGRLLQPRRELRLTGIRPRSRSVTIYLHDCSPA